MPIWQKWVVLIIISCCKSVILSSEHPLIDAVSALGLSLVSGFGGLLGFYIPQYVAVGKGYADITHLMTYPTLFMSVTPCCEFSSLT